MMKVKRLGATDGIPVGELEGLREDARLLVRYPLTTEDGANLELR